MGEFVLSAPTSFYPLTQKAKNLTKIFSTRRRSQLKELAAEIRSTLMCGCRNDSNWCVSHCELGKFVYIQQKCWAGHSRSNTFNSDPGRPYAINEWFNQSWEEFNETHDGDPIGNLDQTGDPFATQVCNKQSCSRHGGAPTWLLRRDNPCLESSHTAGPLCTKCIADYSRSMKCDLVREHIVTRLCVSPQKQGKKYCKHVTTLYCTVDTVTIQVIRAGTPQKNIIMSAIEVLHHILNELFSLVAKRLCW